MVHVSSPGKLMISGEWAIMELGNPCVVVAVDRRIHVRIEENPSIKINMKDFGVTAEAEFDGKKLNFTSRVTEEDFEKIIFLQAAVETTLIYLTDIGKKPMNFLIETWKEPESYSAEDDRIGFGYFASTIASAVAGILKLHEIDITEAKGKDMIFKLSAIAYYSTPGMGGSAYNLAASIYGGALVYRRFDGDWLKVEIDNIYSGKGSMKNLLSKIWPGLYVKEIKLPVAMHVCVGWTGIPAPTRSMVRQMMNFKKQNPVDYNMLITQIRNTTDYLVNYMRNDDWKNTIETLKKNNEYLRELGFRSGVEIETPAIRKLSWIASKHGGAGKMSGAGRGNYGIAICFTKDAADKIKSQWLVSGILPIDVKIDKNGVLEEK